MADSIEHPLGHTTTAEFNADLHLRRLVVPTGENQSFTWDSGGRLTSLTDELGHTISFAYDNPFTRLTRFTDARGNTTIYAYDGSGNLRSTTYPNGSIARSDHYTASTR